MTSDFPDLAGEPRRSRGPRDADHAMRQRHHEIHVVFDHDERGACSALIARSRSRSSRSITELTPPRAVQQHQPRPAMNALPVSNSAGHNSGFPRRAAQMLQAELRDHALGRVGQPGVAPPEQREISRDMFLAASTDSRRRTIGKHLEQLERADTRAG